MIHRHFLLSLAAGITAPISLLAAQAAEKAKPLQLKITFTRPREQWITDMFKGGEPAMYSPLVQSRIIIKMVLSHATLYSIEDAEN